MTKELRPWLLLGAAFLTWMISSTAGAAPPPKLKARANKGSKSGVIFVVEGVGSFDCVGAAAARALPRAGVTHEVRDFLWSHGWGQVFKDLQDIRHVQRCAEELAKQVTVYRTEHPDRPIYLLGKSGGAGLVLATAEQLPPRTLERIILLSAAVSPDYDLRPALRATRHEIVSFYSIHDTFILGWGTRQFGTIDRVYGPSAGLNGFQRPPNLSEADRDLYNRLVEIPWSKDMILEGHWGTHIGTSMPGFVGKEVAPWIK